MGLTLQFLGTGTSVGVPMIGCHCPVCTSADPRDTRRRSGVYVTSASAAFVIDTPPDFRQQCLDAKIERIDAVVFTHSHMDHTAGFDDIRRFNTLNGGKVLNAYGAQETLDSLRHIFPYITDRKNTLGLYRPLIDFVPVDGPFTIGDVTLTPLPVEHGPRTNGYLLESGGRRAAYIPDCIRIPPDVLARIRGVDVMVLDCLRRRPHPAHLNVEGSLAYLAQIAPGRAYLTHLCHDLMHAELEKELPPPVKVAYDGLVVEV